jgi:hypothetical protein
MKQKRCMKANCELQTIAACADRDLCELIEANINSNNSPFEPVNRGYYAKKIWTLYDPDHPVRESFADCLSNSTPEP